MTRVGLDIGGTRVKAATFEDGADLADSRVGVSEVYARPDRDTLLAAIGEALRRAGIDEVSGTIGLCCPGLLNHDRTAVEKAVNVPGLVGTPLAELVGGEVAVAGDAHATAYGWWAQHRPRGRVLCLAIGTGVGAAVLDEGEAVTSCGGTPGHFGQLDVGPCDPEQAVMIGPDGGENTLEAFLGVAALRERFGSKGMLRGLVEPGPHRTALVRAVRIGHAMFRPDTVLLAGGLGLRLAPIVDELRAAIDEGLTSVARPDWELVCGDDDFHAARGAALLAQC